MKTTKCRRSWPALASTLMLAAACGGAPASSPPASTAPTSTPVATAAPTESASELVGEWELEQRCEDIVDRLTEGGFDQWVLDYAAAFVPGATGGADIADPAEPCAGAVPLRHAHTFTADGLFGSRDQVGHEVDFGRYQPVGDGAFQIATELFPAVTYRYEIRDGELYVEPQIPACRPECFEAVWSVTVAFEGLPWTRVDGTAISTPRPWVEDGQAWIVFGRQSVEPDGQSTGSQYLVRPDGTGEHRLVNEVIGSELRAGWSPDGRQIAYIQEARSPEDPANGGLWLINANGTFPRQLTGCDAPCLNLDYLDWAPDGSAIYFGLAGGELDPQGVPTTFEVWRYELATGKAGPVLTRTGDGMTVEQPKISPDGTRVVYLRQAYNEPGAPCAIFVADLEGGPETRLTDWELYASQPDWSVNDRIVFNSFDLRLYDAVAVPGARDLYTIRPDGTGLQRLTDNGIGGVRSGQAHWTPDGSGITYTEWARDVAHIAYINADGSGYRFLTDAGTTGGEPELRP